MHQTMVVSRTTFTEPVENDEMIAKDRLKVAARKFFNLVLRNLRERRVNLGVGAGEHNHNVHGGVSSNIPQ